MLSFVFQVPKWHKSGLGKVCSEDSSAMDLAQRPQNNGGDKEYEGKLNMLMNLPI